MTWTFNLQQAVSMTHMYMYIYIYIYIHTNNQGQRPAAKNDWQVDGHDRL